MTKGTNGEEERSYAERSLEKMRLDVPRGGDATLGLDACRRSCGMEVNGSAFLEWARSARVEKTGSGTRVLGSCGAVANEKHNSMELRGK